MLGFLGLGSLDELYDSIPKALRLDRELRLSAPKSEVDVIEEMEAYADKNSPVGRSLVCFAGGGAYDHDLYSAVRMLGNRGEFVTAYTPYQPEVAQGVLQALFEYQTLISRLSGLPVSNASLYDGASALVEAVNLACAKTGRRRVVISEAVNPNYRQVLDTFAKGPGHEIQTAPVSKDGFTIWPDAAKDIAAYVVAYPNYLGVIEDIETVKSLSVDSGSLLIVAYDPVAVSVCKSPGELGADVAIAEGQALGVPLSFGGPYLGLFSTTKELVRYLPGRLVGQTVDTGNQVAYVTTLRAREQDIRREKASSNVCTNQTLMAIWTAIHLSWLGKGGFKQLGVASLSSRVYLTNELAKANVGTLLENSSTFREFPLHISKPTHQVISDMMEFGFLAGVALDEGVGLDSFADSLIIATTEKRTKSQIDSYVNSLSKVLS